MQPEGCKTYQTLGYQTLSHTRDSYTNPDVSFKWIVSISLEQLLTKKPKKHPDHDGKFMGSLKKSNHTKNLNMIN